MGKIVAFHKCPKMKVVWKMVAFPTSYSFLQAVLSRIPMPPQESLATQFRCQETPAFGFLPLSCLLREFRGIFARLRCHPVVSGCFQRSIFRSHFSNPAQVRSAFRRNDGVRKRGRGVVDVTLRNTSLLSFVANVRPFETHGSL